MPNKINDVICVISQNLTKRKVGKKGKWKKMREIFSCQESKMLKVFVGQRPRLDVGS